MGRQASWGVKWLDFCSLPPVPPPHYSPPWLPAPSACLSQCLLPPMCQQPLPPISTPLASPFACSQVYAPPGTHPLLHPLLFASLPPAPLLPAPPACPSTSSPCCLHPQNCLCPQTTATYFLLTAPTRAGACSGLGHETQSTLSLQPQPGQTAPVVRATTPVLVLDQGPELLLLLRNQATLRQQVLRAFWPRLEQGPNWSCKQVSGSGGKATEMAGRWLQGAKVVGEQRLWLCSDPGLRVRMGAATPVPPSACT